jgi:hypothetical protein
MNLYLSGKGPNEEWPDLAEKFKAGKAHHIASDIGVTAIAGGMSSGAPSVAFRFELADGTTIVAETSLALFLTAGDAMKARYGDPREQS